MTRVHRQSPTARAILVAVAIGVVIGIAGAAAWRAGASIDYLRSLLHAQSPEPAAASEDHPCVHLQGASLYRSGNYAPFADASVADFVDLSDVVAKVVITDVLSPRFNTDTGAAPPPLASDATTEERRAYQNSVFSPVVLDATHIYSGSQVTGYVVWRPGGTTDECPDYEFRVDPEMFPGDVGSTGMVMLMEPTASLLADPPSALAHLVATADELNEIPGNHYEPMFLVNWFLYDTTAGTAECAIQHPITITQLEADVEDATGQ